MLYDQFGTKLPVSHVRRTIGFKPQLIPADHGTCENVSTRAELIILDERDDIPHMRNHANEA